MKSIQVRYLPETNTFPARLKAWAHQVKPVVISVDSMESHPFKSFQQVAAEMIANQFGWLEYNSYTECERVLRGGQLPNGDHSFVIVDIPFSVRKSFIEFKEV